MTTKDNTQDHYKVLGIDVKATQKKIKSAYHKLSLKFHPDKNKDKGASEKFFAIVTAYETLSDVSLRKDYDSNRVAAPKQATSGHDSFATFNHFGFGAPKSSDSKKTNNPKAETFDFKISDNLLNVQERCISIVPGFNKCSSGPDHFGTKIINHTYLECLLGVCRNDGMRISDSISKLIHKMKGANEPFCIHANKMKVTKLNKLEGMKFSTHCNKDSVTQELFENSIKTVCVNSQGIEKHSPLSLDNDFKIDVTEAVLLYQCIDA